MRVLLDHCLDWRLGRLLPSHQVKSAHDMGWDALKNGKLLAAAASQFDVLITVDQNIKNEQNIAQLPIAIVVLIARSNRTKDLEPLIPDVEGALLSLKPCCLMEIDASHGIRVVAPGR
jgi:predicted nuclease of predicted toxin-antitoxin system